MPAAAVIPAPIAYIKVVAVKKLVVGFQERSALVYRIEVLYWPAAASFRSPCLLFVAVGREFGTFTLKKLECSKQAIA